MQTNTQTTIQAAVGTEGRSGPRTAGGRWTIYHPQPSGGGMAFRLELKLDARARTAADGCFFVDLARQTGEKSAGEGKKPGWLFDWEHRLTVRLSLLEAGELLAVLRGKLPEAGAGRHGFFHDNGKGSTVITFQPAAARGGFQFGLSRKDREAAQPDRRGILISEAEAMVLDAVLSQGIFRLFESAAPPVRPESAAATE